ncbi:ETV3 protein, partial [Menura novaehollandiae]|nr:ETV3 protein [Menura novaehollandiae]
GVVPQSAPPVPTASSRFHFPPLDPHSPTEDSQPPSRFPPGSLLPSNPEAADRKPEPPELEENQDWRRDHPLGPGSHPAPAGGSGQKRKPDVVLPLFSRPGIFPDPHSPFSVSPLPGRGGSVLNVPISPALSLTPTLFSYSPSPGLSPFAGSSCFSFNPEEMKHYLHSQACSVFNYHLSPRTFPRFPLVVPPLQCQIPMEEQPQFPIKLQPPPAGRKNRERPGSAEEAATLRAAAAPARVKVEDKEDEEPLEKRDGREEDSALEEEEERKAAPVFARPAAPAWIPAHPGIPGGGDDVSLEGPSRDPSGDPGAPEKREDALMPPKLRLKRRWNGREKPADIPGKAADIPEERHNGAWH